MPSKHAPGHDSTDHKLPTNRCFGCGPDNPDGMKLEFHLNDDGNRFVCNFKLSQRYTGPPGHAHGGIIATILDEAMGKANKLSNVVAVTSEMTVQYLKPVPLGEPLVVEGWGERVLGRIHTNMAEIRNGDGTVLARSTGKFIVIDPQKMFGKFVEK